MLPQTSPPRTRGYACTGMQQVSDPLGVGSGPGSGPVPSWAAVPTVHLAGVGNKCCAWIASALPVGPEGASTVPPLAERTSRLSRRRHRGRQVPAVCALTQEPSHVGRVVETQNTGSLFSSKTTDIGRDSAFSYKICAKGMLIGLRGSKGNCQGCDAAEFHELVTNRKVPLANFLTLDRQAGWRNHLMDQPTCRLQAG